MYIITYYVFWVAGRGRAKHC